MEFLILVALGAIVMFVTIVVLIICAAAGYYNIFVMAALPVLGYWGSSLIVWGIVGNINNTASILQNLIFF